jgi:hypothetical protein
MDLEMSWTGFWLGTHLPGWLAVTDVPLFVSRRRLAGRKTLPRALGPVAIDSGGFSELSLYGRWETPARQYAGEARRFVDEIGNVEWLAIQDWMCEPHLLAKTGLTVREHQRRTVASYLELQQIAPDLPWTPVLQGWARDDYRRHVDDYDRAGVDLRTLAIVGIGSVCRRQATSEIVPLIRSVARTGIRLHGFGVKISGLRQIASQLTSADSMAWSFEARRQPVLLPGHTSHINCANCLPWALRWRDRVLSAPDMEPTSYQPDLWEAVS